MFFSLFAFFLIAFSFARFLFIGKASLEPADYPRVFLYKKAAAIATAFLLPVFRKALSFAQLYEIVVDTAPIQQLFMCALFGDFPLGHDDDLIRRADGI